MSRKIEDVRSSRRGFVKGAVGVAAAVPVATVLRGRDALADHHEMPKLAEDDPQAVALSYKHNAADAEGAGEGQNCAGCQLYTGGDAEWGPCSIFAGKAVSAKGWCATWVKRAG
ncbi:MAG: high-potential iron-sulfur protein [Pseudomonadota bacterium]